jgi:hypothetical protein
MTTQTSAQRNINATFKAGPRTGRHAEPYIAPVKVIEYPRSAPRVRFEPAAPSPDVALALALQNAEQALVQAIGNPRAMRKAQADLAELRAQHAQRAAALRDVAAPSKRAAQPAPTPAPQPAARAVATAIARVAGATKRAATAARGVGKAAKRAASAVTKLAKALAPIVEHRDGTFSVRGGDGRRYAKRGNALRAATALNR